MTAARSVNDTAAQSVWALPAWATDRSRSAGDASPTRPISIPVAGSMTAIVPPSGAVHSPVKIFPLHRCSSRKFMSLLHSLGVFGTREGPRDVKELSGIGRQTDWRVRIVYRDFTGSEHPEVAVVVEDFPREILVL